MWAMGFNIDPTVCGRRLKYLKGINHHRRPCLAIMAGRHMEAKDLVSVVEDIISVYLAPIFLL